MRSLLALTALALAITAVAASPEPRRSRGPSKPRKGFHVDFQKEANETELQRDAKFFPIFSIVQFRNEPCQSNAGVTGSGNQRNGTCYTTTECRDRGGTSSGNCAAGFGVCCIFIVSDSDTITENCTYIQNPNYPQSETSSSSITYNIDKCDDDVCFLRLDFETFTLQGVGGTNIAHEGICLDTFQVTTSTSQNIPTICGLNTGYHMYVDIGANSGDSASLMMSFDGSNTARLWDIKVTQIECTNQNAPPDTCLQYHTGLTGRIETFNYQATNDNHLNLQNYNVCIRPEAGFCCIEYMLCADQDPAEAFSLDSDLATDMAKTDDDCLTTDHVLIPESAAECNRAGSSGTRNVATRYCSSHFNFVLDQPQNDIVCDCTPPFTVGIWTDNAANQSPGTATTATNTIHSRGLCLQYMQIAC